MFPNRIIPIGGQFYLWILFSISAGVCWCMYAYEKLDCNNISKLDYIICARVSQVKYIFFPCTPKTIIPVLSLQHLFVLYSVQTKLLNCKTARQKSQVKNYEHETNCYKEIVTIVLPTTSELFIKILHKYLISQVGHVYKISPCQSFFKNLSKIFLHFYMKTSAPNH